MKFFNDNSTVLREFESPRWLISKGYYYRAAKALSEIASDLWNRASIEINVKQIQNSVCWLQMLDISISFCEYTMHHDNSSNNLLIIE
ncbi:hypothetical protein T4E_5568 [Trichinella pseudospiralis]|uniref:Uncharacterized protein n=1 Tax=Trichinella pseudospiralis TaxID=6337 RepID=A0A0V0Y3L3_TRIPS|nr:hypothetical protein T4E_5568 [Trichinella pseudospiralis]